MTEKQQWRKVGAQTRQIKSQKYFTMRFMQRGSPVPRHAEKVVVVVLGSPGGTKVPSGRQGARGYRGTQPHQQRGLAARLGLHQPLGNGTWKLNEH